MNADVTRPTFVVSRLQCDKSHARGGGCAYQVGCAINPHMRPGEVALKSAHRQHARFRGALEAAGACLIDVPFVHGACDSVFSKDNAVLTGSALARRALMTKPRHGQRACEQDARARILCGLGFDVQASPAHYLEGGDVAVLPSGRVLMGHGPRSSIDAASALSRFMGAEVVTLELVDPYFFHLDVALSVLSDGTLLLYPDAFTPEALAKLEQLTRVVKVPREEAIRFGLNMVEVGDAVILGSRAPTVAAALEERGWRPVVVSLEQFHLSGGSAACLTAKIHG